MTGKDIATCLANLLFVARSDGALKPKEKSRLDRIRSELGAQERQMKEAESLAAGQDYEPGLPERFSDQVRNLEDMVFLCQADGKIAPAERNVIASFAKKIGVSQEQLEAILSRSSPRAEVQAAPDKTARPAAAPKRKKPAETGPVFEYPEEGISVEFAESTSGSFEAAVMVASTAPDFREATKSNVRWYLATWPRDRIMDVVNLVENLTGVDNRRAYVDGKEIPWDDLFGFVACMRQRDSAYLPGEHCFGVDDNVVDIWGCKELGMHWSEYGQWFTYGHFKEKDVFVFDKKKIQDELKRRLQKYRFCPYLRLTLINSVLQLLPSEVKVSRDAGWKYRGYDRETPNSMKVTIRDDAGGEGVTRTIYARGVGPIGLDTARELLKEAFKKCGIIDVDYRAIAP